MGRASGALGCRIPLHARPTPCSGADRARCDRSAATCRATGRAGGDGDDLRRFRAHRARRHDALATPAFFCLLQRQRGARFDDRREPDRGHGGPVHALANLARGHGDRDANGRLDASGARPAGRVPRGDPGVGNVGKRLCRTDDARARPRLARHRFWHRGGTAAACLRLAGDPLVDRQGGPHRRHRPATSRQSTDRQFLGPRCPGAAPGHRDRSRGGLPPGRRLPLYRGHVDWSFGPGAPSHRSGA